MHSVELLRIINFVKYILHTRHKLMKLLEEIKRSGWHVHPPLSLTGCVRQGWGIGIPWDPVWDPAAKKWIPFGSLTRHFDPSESPGNWSNNKF